MAARRSTWATNDLDVSAGNLASVTASISRGYNLAGGGNWAGAGITSSAAAASTSHNLALGVVQNNQGASPLFGTANAFDGFTPGSSDVLVKYTYFGDANLDGKVDGSDYSLIDNAYNKEAASPGLNLSGWFNGDFNYDGTVDGSDYTLIDNAFDTQGAPLAPSGLFASTTDQIAAGTTSAVPEPASLGVATLVIAALFRRRTR